MSRLDCQRGARRARGAVGHELAEHVHRRVAPVPEPQLHRVDARLQSREVERLSHPERQVLRHFLLPLRRQGIEPEERQLLQHDRRTLGDLERDVDVARRALDDRVHRRRRESAPPVQHLDPQHVTLQFPLVHVLLGPEPDPLHEADPRKPARVRRRDRSRERRVVDRLVALEGELPHHQLTVRLCHRARRGQQRPSYQGSHKESGPRELHALRLPGGELTICKEIRHSRVACTRFVQPSRSLSDD